MEDTIGAIGTALGESGIGIVRLSGPDSEHIIEQLFIPVNRENWSRRQSHRLYLGHFRKSGSGQEVIDQVLVVIMKGPHSYTGEDVAEIHCHGGYLVVRSVLEAVLNQGARLAEPGEFTRRAFLNGKLDLAQAEATIDLIRSKSRTGLAIAVGNLDGKLSQLIDYCQEELLRILAYCEASIDFPEDEIEVMQPEEIEEIITSVINRLERLLADFDKGRLLQDGVKTVILGKPNVGKSSLLNAILGRERAIVTDIPGTTRDLIEEYVDLGGIPLRMVDTAGIRPTEDLVEKIGVEKTKEVLKEADLALLVLDAATGLTDNDQLVWQLAKEAGVPLIVLINKVDLDEVAIGREQLKQMDSGLTVLEISALSGYGLPALEEKVQEMVGLGEVRWEGEPLITRLRHRQAVTKAVDHLKQLLVSLEQGLPEDFLTIDLRGAWEALGEINGKTVGEDVLDRIFAEFCIGK
ncbi:MAG: tRNA uridine-5-carboxymethylaminomethyl(34) synthesis GTPase MnmE [Clostridia bacterium]|jgi:tRNA modification GTPase|nr:tRNA uridine-5-carboxymethylaminomethyl(34) synthesis GTPase MnmE [Clostridia bacterium]